MQVSKTGFSISRFFVGAKARNIAVIGVLVNFQEKNIAGIVSQVLVLGAIDNEGKVVLLHPSQKVEDGLSIA